MDREQMQRCLDVVAAYRASGLKAKVWARAHGVPHAVRAALAAGPRR